jgi:hypothetical protein
VFVQQSGCNSDGKSQNMVVKPTPNPLPVPTVADPVRPGSPWVHVSGVVPGAQVYLTVNGSLLSGSVEARDTTVLAPVTDLALINGDKVVAIQTMCALMNASATVTATPGDLHVTVTPTQVVRGTTTKIIVRAVDAVTNTDVVGTVILNGQAPMLRLRKEKDIRKYIH